MGGGGSSTGQPYDLLGGQYASFSGGTPSNDINWWGLAGKGLQSAGKGITSGTTPIPSTDVPNLQGTDIQSPPERPINIQQNNLIEALLRLLGGGQG